MAFYSLPLPAPATASSPPAPSTRATTSRCARSPTAPAPRVVVVPDDEHGQVDVAALASDARRARQARLARARPDPGRARQPRRRGRRRLPRGRRAAPARRLPVGRPDAGRRRRDRLRHALRHRAQVPARPARHRLPLRPPRPGRALEPPFLDLHAAEWRPDGSYRIRPDARRFENWETNIATKIGLGVAVDYALAWGLEAIRARVRALAADLRERLDAMPGVHVHDLGEERCAIVTFSVDGHAAAEVVRDAGRRRHQRLALARQPTAASTSASRGLDDLVRASVHYYNEPRRARPAGRRASSGSRPRRPRAARTR